MASYKLTYFNLKAIAEPIRLLFTYAEVPFENIEVESAKWAELKKQFKWEQLPYLEFDGKTLTQSTVILTFLSKKFGLYPEDILEQARLDEIMAAVQDLRLYIRPLVMEKFNPNYDAELHEKTKSELLSGVVPLYLRNIEEILLEIKKEKPSGSNFILGGEKPTGADFWLANFTDIFLETFFGQPELLEKYPLLKKQQKAVYSLPKVAEWIAKRPTTFI